MTSQINSYQKWEKTLYAEFKRTRKPVDIIASYGYHLDIVEFEYARFLKDE